MGEHPPFNARRVAEGALNRCCEGDPWPTFWNLLCFEFELLTLSLRRATQRLRSQPRSIVRCRPDPRYGGRALEQEREADGPVEDSWPVRGDGIV